MKFIFEQHGDYTHITAENSTGLVLTLASIGASIRCVKLPMADGVTKTVTLAPLNEELFAAGYHGKTIGRTSGRICNATFSIDGKTATLERNNHGVDNLHGGASGLHAKVFDWQIVRSADYADVVFSYTSPDGEGGYFGEVKLTVTYRVMERENTFRIVFDGKADCRTLLNLTNHVYWNLSGDLAESTKEQTLFINAPRYGKLNERLIVEEVLPVSKQMDFTTPQKIGDYVYEDSVQLYTKGYDHPYFLAEAPFSQLAASLYSAVSGVRLEVRTTYPCIVFYADGQARSDLEVLPGKYDEQYLAACLECQYHPDGIHQAASNCGVTSPDEPYHHEIEYKFLLD